MTELVWVALISAGAALVTALLTQYLAMKAAHRQADRSDQREARQWQKNEALRLEELSRQEAQAALQWQRSEAKALRDQRRADVQAMWSHALHARARLADMLEADSWVRSQSLEESATGAAAHAYAVALVGLPDVREQAKAFYEATARLEGAQSEDAMKEVSRAWRDAFKRLEQAVADHAKLIS